MNKLYSIYFNILFLDLVQGMKQIHETLITLAGRLQNTHHEVQAQKQMYLQLRRLLP